MERHNNIFLLVLYKCNLYNIKFLQYVHYIISLDYAMIILRLFKQLYCFIIFVKKNTHLNYIVKIK